MTTNTAIVATEPKKALFDRIKEKASALKKTLTKACEKVGINPTNKWTEFLESVSNYFRTQYKNLPWWKRVVRLTVDTIAYVTYNAFAFLGYCAAFLLVFC